MNIGRVYLPPTFIAMGIGGPHEYRKGVGPTNIHREGYRPLYRGYRGT